MVSITDHSLITTWADTVRARDARVPTSFKGYIMAIHAKAELEIHVLMGNAQLGIGALV